MTSRFVTAALFLLLVSVSPYVFAADQDNIQKNVIDLRTAKFFARPITELEMIVINLKAQAKDSADFVGEMKGPHIIKTVGLAPDGDARLDPTTGRIFLTLELHVEEMSDPWKEACDSTIGNFYYWFFFPPKEVNQASRLGLMQKYFGEAIRIDKDNATDAIDIFLNSIVTRVTFLVGPDPSAARADNTRPALEWMRTCTKDNLTGKTSYTVYRYR